MNSSDDAQYIIHFSILKPHSSVESLQNVDSETLGLSYYSHLPHVTLLRTQGGLVSEILCQSDCPESAM